MGSSFTPNLNEDFWREGGREGGGKEKDAGET